MTLVSFQVPHIIAKRGKNNNNTQFSHLYGSRTTNYREEHFMTYTNVSCDESECTRVIRSDYTHRMLICDTIVSFDVIETR